MDAQISSVLRCAGVMLLSAASLLVQATTAPVIYPAKGQSPAQMDQDKYSCFQWGKAQSGFDPMAPAPQAAAPTQTAMAPSTSSNSMNGSMVKGAARSRPPPAPSPATFDPELVLWAIHRGAMCNVDMTHQWRFWPLMPLPIDEARARVALLPKLQPTLALRKAA